MTLGHDETRTLRPYNVIHDLQGTDQEYSTKLMEIYTGMFVAAAFVLGSLRSDVSEATRRIV